MIRTIVAQTFFKRSEKKYVLSPDQHAVITRLVSQHMVRDVHFRSTITNIYFDTENSELVIASLESPDYKYKVRARRYMTTARSNKVFFEIKSKLKGIVYKRRVKLSQNEYETYLEKGEYPDSQVMREVDRLFSCKSLVPKMYIAYDRTAYTATDESGLRITFDTNLRSRTHDLDIEKTDECEHYFADKTSIMEIKATNGLPAWLCEALTARHIYPSSFSKYGKIYEKQMAEEYAHA